jgi:outer membrane protein, heavy metal efflux system
MKHRLWILTGLLVAAGNLTAAEPHIANEAYLASIRAEARRKHPAVKSAELKAGAAAHDVRAVRLWDDPMVGLMFMGAEKEMRMDDGDIRVMLEQPLPKPGLFQANRAKADAMRKAEVENSRTASLSAGAMAAKDAIELALADESIELQAGQIGWLRTMAENARLRALNPGETSVDALRLESELAKEEQVLAAAKRTREGIAQRLNLNLGRPLEQAWGPMKLPASPPPVPVATAEVARIPRVNPRVLAMKEMASAAQAETRVADRERLPGVSLAVESSMYSGGEFRSASVGVKLNLPWFNEPSYQARIDSARLREKAAVTDIDTTVREIATEVITMTTEAANAAHQARAYSGDIITRNEEATRALEASWISSKSMLTDLLDSNRLLFSTRLEQRRFIAMQLSALEDLQVLVPTQH